MIRAMRRRLRKDEGFSLTEMLVVMAIFGVLMAITFSILVVVMKQTRDSEARVRSLAQMRLGLSQIDRQVRSGNLIRDPADEVGTAGSSEDVPPYYSMRIYTQEGGEARCAQWRVIDHEDDGYGNLEFRTWDPTYPASTDVDDWHVVARNILDVGARPDPDDPDAIDPNDPLTWPPFWADSSLGSSTDAQFVRITFRFKEPEQSSYTKPASVTSVVTGRNTVFGYPSTSCSNVPPA